MSRQNVKKFQESITKELTLTKDRVELLIGSANWGDVGRYKEAILRKSIAQFLPSNLTIGTGFIVGNTDYINGEDLKTSSQLDIIIYDNSIPIVFGEGEFVIVTESSVRAVVEVKTKIINYANPEGSGNDNALNKILIKLNGLKKFQSFRVDMPERKKFIGVFSFDYEKNYTNTRVDDALLLSNGLVNHISLGPNKFIRYWSTTEGLRNRPDHAGRCYIRYDLENLSFSYFISNLIHFTANEEPRDRLWFSFPIEGTKEEYRSIISPVIPLNG